MSRKNKRRGLEPGADAPRPGGARLGRVLLALGATAAALFMAEAWCRRVFKKNVESLAFSESDLYYYYDPAGYRHNIPNKVGYERMWNAEGKAEFRINSLGFRGPEIGLTKPAGTFRILFLGDSITLGGRLPEDATYVSRVARALAPAPSASPRLPAADEPQGAGRSENGRVRYEVANAGVGDVGLYEEEQTLRTNGIKIRPDLVVLCWYLNDARPPVGFPEEVVYKNPLIRWFNHAARLRRSYLAGFLYSRLRDGIVRRQIHLMDAENRREAWIPLYNAGVWAKDLEGFLRVVDAARFDWGDGWNDRSLSWMADKIAELRDFARARGVRFAVVMMPVHAQIYAPFKSPLVDKPQTRLAERLAGAGIPYLNLLPILRKHSEERPFYDQCHYTPRGNEIVAAAILDFLRSSGGLPSD